MSAGPGFDERQKSQLIRALRRAKAAVDPWRPLGLLHEEERTVDGLVPSVTVFLAGAECPFTCVFCDLWKNTLEGPTPAGALPRQLERALGELAEVPAGARLKLYNASNFFDRRAVPPEDIEAIVALTAGFERVVVECHPRLVDERCFDFSRQLDGHLEVAMGLETVHPSALPRLNKAMSLGDWDEAVAKLREADIPVRSFVLIGAPFVPDQGLVHWSVVTAAYALNRGVESVSLIPVRGGNGELERLASEGSFREPRLNEIETAFEQALALEGGTVLLDTWDLDRFTRCPECSAARIERLKAMDRTGRLEDRVPCDACESQPGQAP